MNGKKNIKKNYLKSYYEYFRELLVIQDYILENPIYSESYYECLNLIFKVILGKKSETQKIIHSDYVHKIHKLFTCIKYSKITNSKLIREVKITKNGIIQCKKKQSHTEKLLEHVELLPDIKLTNEIRGKQFKLGFINQKEQIKWIYFDKFEDARKVRDYCFINSAINNLQYNLAGFVRLLAIRFNDFLINSMRKKIKKACEEMENLQIQEQSQSQTLSFYSPGIFDKNEADIQIQQELSFQEIQEVNCSQNQLEIDFFIARTVERYLDSILEEQIEFLIQDDSEMESESILNVSILQISEHQKSKYSENNSITQMYIT